MKKSRLSILLSLVFFICLTGCQGCASTSSMSTGSIDVTSALPKTDKNPDIKFKYNLRSVGDDSLVYKESWGYVLQDRLEAYNKDLPVTDVCFFAAEVNSYGELDSIPDRSRINTGEARCHMVIVCDSRSLTHFVLSPDYKVREEIITSIVKASKPYDGIQLDLEYIPSRDRRNFISFIAELRSRLPDKILSVCVPARFKLLSEDMYPYKEIASLVDRVFVMAYDEHWSTSKPGPVASVDWCRKVASYAVSTVPDEKLIMGIPFYGRSWANHATSGAWTYGGVSRVLNENNVKEVTYENDIPKFTYKTEVTVEGYFNDVYSCVALGRMYQEMGVKNIGFWRVGQEDPDFWNHLEIAE